MHQAEEESPANGTGVAGNAITLGLTGSMNHTKPNVQNTIFRY